MTATHSTHVLPLRIATLAFATSLAGCAANPEDYRGTSPEFDMPAFFDGPLEAWGMFQERDGSVRSRFHVEMIGQWDGDTGMLREQFTYDDGTSQERVWEFQKVGAHRFFGNASDVVGPAEGQSYGYAFNLKYVLALEVGGTTYHVDMDDWMYRIDDETVLNRTQMSKFGVRVGDVTLVIRKTKSP